MQKFESNNILTEITNLRFILNIIHKLLALDWYFGKRDKRFETVHLNFNKFIFVPRKGVGPLLLS
ncbi:MAG: hypothetical protein UR52_C0025G0005 [Candidatus Gottesmanbacteria bacterium GW2011_GWA1_34_13]|uniref:Uncharacterized protein n=1 Tax=Candidatus Gottesmanbacteria bacterium GW2011_GWA1_34_13 TaxID=1618434 RepID=A0A0G0ALI9_9BACT|nr:MAG: hypothetical protein UR52_C0025G0005 [Candidatus Gottesmanbacteria bacterium GW2011_GWA1_34_13]